MEVPPDQFEASDWWNHSVNDTGGIYEKGGPALGESIKKQKDDLVDPIKEKWDEINKNIGRGIRDFENWIIWQSTGYSR